MSVNENINLIDKSEMVAEIKKSNWLFHQRTKTASCVPVPDVPAIAPTVVPTSTITNFATYSKKN
jgi:hypothetical protein